MIWIGLDDFGNQLHRRKRRERDAERGYVVS